MLYPTTVCIMCMYSSSCICLAIIQGETFLKYFLSLLLLWHVSDVISFRSFSPRWATSPGQLRTDRWKPKLFLSLAGSCTRMYGELQWSRPALKSFSQAATAEPQLFSLPSLSIHTHTQAGSGSCGGGAGLVSVGQCGGSSNCFLMLAGGAAHCMWCYVYWTCHRKST